MPASVPAPAADRDAEPAPAQHAPVAERTQVPSAERTQDGTVAYLRIASDQVEDLSRAVHDLTAALHVAPATLRERIQAAIDAVPDGYDAVVLAYGLCGGATAGIRARGIPVVLTRAPRDGVPPKRFCSSLCQLRAQRARWKARRRAALKEKTDATA